MNKRRKKNVSEDRRPVTRSINLKNVSNNSLSIPVELIEMIFAKLELKSIARFRCLSKGWASILRSSYFTELILNRSHSSSPKLLFVFRKNGELFFFTSSQPQNPNDNWSHVISNYQFKFSVDQYCEIGDLVNGLICLKDIQIFNGKRKMVLKICNPSTRQLLVLPKVRTSRVNVFSLLGYDPIGKQFKVLVMTTKREITGQYQVLTLGCGKMSWKMIECCTPHYPPRKKICINGVVYYTSIDNIYGWIDGLAETCLIVCFDVKSENFNFIKTTGIIKKAMSDYTIELINYNGKLGLLQCERKDFEILNGRSIRYNLWVLEDLGKEEWSNHTFLFPIGLENRVGVVGFVGVTQTNEIVLSLSSYSFRPFYLVYLNLEKKTIVKVTIQGMEAVEDSLFDPLYTFLHHVENVELF